MKLKLLNHKNLDMTQGNALKVIVFFTIPLLLGNLFQQLYNVVDSYIVGDVLGDDAMGAVSSSGSLINLLIGLIQGISVGGGIVVAQHFGAKNKDRMRKCEHTLVIFGVVLGIAMTIIGYVLSPILLRKMETPEEILPLSIEYFQVYFLGVIFTIMYNCFASILRAVGDSRHPLYYLILATLINVVVDILFIRVLHMGIKGAAFATIISQGVSALLTLLQLLFTKEDYKLKFKELKFTKEELILILKYGIPTGLQNSIISLSNVFIQKNINAFGNTATSGYGAYVKIEGFATLPSGSFSMTLSTFVGQNVGAKKYDRAKKGGMIGLLTSVIVTEMLGIGLAIFARPLVDLFTDTEAVIDIGMKPLHIIAPFFGLLAFSHGMSGVLRGAGYSKTPMFIMIICWVAVRISLIPVALNIPGWNRIETIFWFYPFTWSLSFIALNVNSRLTLFSKKKFQTVEDLVLE